MEVCFSQEQGGQCKCQAVGGTERFRYMVGLGYYDEQGIMINSGYKRANLISNLTAQFTPKLRMDTRVFSLMWTGQ